MAEGLGIVDVARLADACADSSREAGIQITTALEPIAGRMAPIKPATYAGGVFQEDERWWGEPPERTGVIVIDNPPSQANRLEAALHGMRSEFGLPEIVLDLTSVGNLPTHLPRQISSFRFPHRQADAYLRDAVLDGTPFPRSAAGAAIIDATADRPEALFRWFPQALLFGYWQSHLGKKRTQSKLARSWVSEIVGYAPATSAGHRTGLSGTKGDPLNLAAEERVEYVEDDILAGWDLTARAGKEAGPTGQRKKEKLSEIGHGQVPYANAALASVSFKAIEQHTTVSFAGLRRIKTSAQGRGLLVALGLIAHVDAFGRPFSLRSGCDLRPVRSSWRWLGPDRDQELQALDFEGAADLLRHSVEAAGELASDGGWKSEPLVLRPNSALQKAIELSWPVRE
ncbi:MAG TPA: type I-U CRISPR-associated RAMP protein Csb1/Cas7u [Chloroflexota bacterium]|nr:type I-U CRISPR-associated RAMP protein Csb1/Cas7u [Chloroflexota bacterium]